MLLLATLLLAFTSRDRSILLGRQSSIDVQGIPRTYRVVGGGTGKDRRLVIALHGLSGDGRQFAYYTALHNAFGSDTVVAYPDSTAKSAADRAGWNAGFCCGSGWKQGVDDVAFLAALIDTLVADNHIAKGRVFVVGFSNGGFMAERLAAERPDLVAGVAVMSGTIGTKANVLHPASPVPMLLTHGAKDQRVRYDGGESPGDPEFDWQSFATTVNAWKQANGCPDGAGRAVSSSTQVTTVYENCKAPLKTIEYHNNGHVWDGWRLANVWTKRPRASIEVVHFFDEILANPQTVTP